MIILAAGESKRLGRPKQLLDLKGMPLIHFILKEALLSGLKPLILVLGSSSALIQKEIEEDGVHVLNNNHWKEGMSSSIKAGLELALQLEPSLDGAIIAVCDQPFISSSLLHQLVEQHSKTLLPIVASSYQDTIGTPAFFHRSIFPELMELTGDAGAKGILKKNPARVTTVSFPNGSFDIDTNDDYKNLREIF